MDRKKKRNVDRKIYREKDRKKWIETSIQK